VADQQENKLLLGTVSCLFCSDLEWGWYGPGTVSGENSYCGVYSLKNPSYLFQTEEEPFSATIYPEVTLDFRFSRVYSPFLAANFFLSKIYSNQNCVHIFLLSMIIFTKCDSAKYIS